MWANVPHFVSVSSLRMFKITYDYYSTLLICYLRMKLFCLCQNRDSFLSRIKTKNYCPISTLSHSHGEPKPKNIRPPYHVSFTIHTLYVHIKISRCTEPLVYICISHEPQKKRRVSLVASARHKWYSPHYFCTHVFWISCVVPRSIYDQVLYSWRIAKCFLLSKGSLT